MQRYNTALNLGSVLIKFSIIMNAAIHYVLTFITNIALAQGFNYKHGLNTLEPNAGSFGDLGLQHFRIHSLDASQAAIDTSEDLYTRSPDIYDSYHPYTCELGNYVQ